MLAHVMSDLHLEFYKDRGAGFIQSLCLPPKVKTIQGK